MRNKLLTFGLIAILFSLSVSALECAEFQDNVWWSNCFGSELSIDQCDTSYYTWNVGNKCPGKEDCFIKNIKAYVRTFYFGSEPNPIGYAQISNAKETDCKNPSKAEYSNYIVYQTATGPEAPQFAWDCGDAQDNNLCSLKISDEYAGDTDCYSVKVYGDKYLVADVYNVNYTWCWTKSQEDGEAVKIAENKTVTAETEKSNSNEVGNQEITESSLFWKYFILTLSIIIVIFIILRTRRKHGH